VEGFVAIVDLTDKIKKLAAGPGEVAYASLQPNDRVVLLVNNLGGLSYLELAVATRAFACNLVRVF
jgi:dihydroxyacetone kinase